MRRTRLAPSPVADKISGSLSRSLAQTLPLRQTGVPGSLTYVDFGAGAPRRYRAVLMFVARIQESIGRPNRLLGVAYVIGVQSFQDPCEFFIGLFDIFLGEDYLLRGLLVT